MSERAPAPQAARASGSTCPLGPRELARRARELRIWIGRQIVDQRTEAGITQAELARCAGIDPAHLLRIECGQVNASPDVLLALGACLGSELSVRLYPAAGPRLHDRFQAPMIEALIREVGQDWRPQPEFLVPAARGVVDLVLRRDLDHLTVACECHSELRRLELVIRRLVEKANAVRAEGLAAGPVSTMLLLRSTRATREVARAFGATLAAAFPAPAWAALASLRGNAPWPGAAIVWARVEGGRAEILDGPPRGVRVGR